MRQQVLTARVQESYGTLGALARGRGSGTYWFLYLRVTAPLCSAPRAPFTDTYKIPGKPGDSPSAS